MKVMVIGAGGHARMVGYTLSRFNDIEIMGFLDGVKKKKNEKIVGTDVIKTKSIIDYLENDNVKNVFLAIGDNHERKKYFEKLKKKNYNIINAVHPSAYISDNADVGDGVFIGINVMVGPEVKIGNNTIINNGSIIDHESNIGNNVQIGPGVNIAGRVDVGDESFIGIGASVIDNIILGKGVTVAAGSVVIKDVDGNTKVAGVPAKPI